MKSTTFTISNEQARERACEVINSIPIDPLHEVVIKEKKANRSLAQNSLLHRWMSEVSQQIMATHGKFYSPEHWKWYFKDMFLGNESIAFKNKTITQLKSTSKLKVGPFAEFLTTIDRYCITEMGICLSQPEDIYQEAMGRKKGN